MKTSATVLVLLALLALAPGVPCSAEEPSAATAPETSPITAAPAVPSTADFLETLAPPKPKPLSTICTGTFECPAGEICCYPCGIDGCDWVCMTPVRNRCPFWPA